MGTERLKRVDTLTPPSDERERASDEGAASDLWALAQRPSYDQMSQVAREARNLLGALGANMDWLKSVIPERPPLEDLAEGLSDIETCCERLRDLVEDALIGARKEGLSVSRAIVSLEAMLAVCVRQVKRRAAARQISIEVVGGELYAMLDGPLLTRAMVRLLDQVVRQVDAGSLVQVRYGRENGEIRMIIAKFEPGLRSIAPAGGSYRPPSLRPAASVRPPRAVVSDQVTEALEFVHLAVEAHGGKLMVGASALYRICLPCVETRHRR
jgi:signal transduction histidine kinase